MKAIPGEKDERNFMNWKMSAILRVQCILTKAPLIINAPAITLTYVYNTVRREDKFSVDWKLT